MKKIKTASLSEAALDHMVHAANYRGVGAHPHTLLKQGCRSLPFSTKWEYGGPIIEREKITTEYLLTCHELCWASYSNNPRQNSINRKYGKTQLEAAMRCFVASKLGDEVEVPEELINEIR